MHIPLGVDTVVVHIKFNSVVSKEAYKYLPTIMAKKVSGKKYLF